ISNPGKSNVEDYVLGDDYDENRTKAFIHKLLLHRIKLYELEESVKTKGKTFSPGNAYYVPAKQPQYRMVQTMFETYQEYTD
ncbi:hypothetical protein J9332_43810, partial [Aquimarina celericrescens]|nr:hypothetical protein [Aquimarina celericrescens]